MSLTRVRADALLVLERHGALRPLDIVRWLGYGRRWLGAVLGWAVPLMYVKRHGSRYALLPDGRDWLRQQGVLHAQPPPATGPTRVFRC